MPGAQSDTQPDTQIYKSLLTDLRNDYSQRIAALSNDIQHKDEAVEKDFAEQATQSENDDVLNALDDEAKVMLIQIDNALRRIQEGQFGLCTGCGKAINEQRLQAVPYAALCIECAEKE